LKIQKRTALPKYNFKDAKVGPDSGSLISANSVSKATQVAFTLITNGTIVSKIHKGITNKEKDQ
jgi:hypothetical protein